MNEVEVVVTSPNSEKPSPQVIPAQVIPAEVQAQTITQAENYGMMSEAFRRTQQEAEQIRLEMVAMRAQQEQMLNQQMHLQTQNEKLLQAIEEEEEEEIPLQESSNGLETIVTPPIVTPIVTETKPKKAQSRLNRLLFGKEDEDE